MQRLEARHVVQAAFTDRLSGCFEAMKEWALLQAPQEVCGVLVCENEESYQIYQLPNLSDNPNTSWEIDPELIPLIVNELEFYEFVYVWHSHPGGTVGPSKQDLEVASMRVRYMVITIPSGEVISYQRHK